jgi:single-strand DNA-binding protein
MSNKGGLMHTVNQVVLYGRLGADPEHRVATSGTEVVRFSVATHRNIRDGDSWREETDWHRVVAFDRTARVAIDSLRRGDPVAIVGQLRQQSWTDKEGNRRKQTEVQASRICFAPSPRGDAAPEPPGEESSPESNGNGEAPGPGAG